MMAKTKGMTKMTSTSFFVRDIHCWECANRLAMALEARAGIERATVDGETGVSSVTFRAGDVDLVELVDAIRRSGHDVELVILEPRVPEGAVS